MPWHPERLADTIRRQMADYRQEVGARLRLMRMAKGWNQADAAHEVGVGPKTWHLWETGKTQPYERNWRRIGEVFDIDPAEIRGIPPTLPGEDAAPIRELRSELEEIHRKLDILLGREGGEGNERRAS